MKSVPSGESPTRALVDLASLRSNLRLLRAQAPGIEMIGVVKADAYGHGSVAVSRELISEGLGALAVATVPEAVELRKAGIECRILVFGAPRRPSVGACVEYRLEPFVTSVESLDVLKSAGPLDIHLHIDTGMGRLGVAPDETPGLLLEIERTSHLNLAGISTHFADAGREDSDLTRRQLERWQGVLKRLGSAPAPVHVASSGALFTINESADPAVVDLARVGIALYGLLDSPRSALERGFKPVMTLLSEVSRIAVAEAGSTVSYGGRWTASERTRIATVAAGYADGYPRLLTNRSSVSIRGRVCPVVGTICMDLMMADLGPPGPEADPIECGDPVVLFGEGGPSAIDIARLAETIPYEIVCGVSHRVERVHINASA